MKHKKDKKKKKEKKKSKERKNARTDEEMHFDEKTKEKKEKISKSKSKKSGEIGVPFAELMRRKRKYNDTISDTIDSENTNEKRYKYEDIGDTKTYSDPIESQLTSLNNIEEQIKSLEADLSSQSSSSSSYDEDSNDSNELPEKKDIICISSCSSDRIVPLPTKALPNNKRRYLKVDKAHNSSEQPPNKKKKNNTENDEHHQGLKKAVNDLLKNYVPRSNERLPFYCRVCSIQSSSLEEFNIHKQTEFHQVAIKEEKKATFCRICRKQFTSMAQLKEHLQAKPHKERVDLMMSKNRSRKKFC